MRNKKFSDRKLDRGTRGCSIGHCPISGVSPLARVIREVDGGGCLLGCPNVCDARVDIMEVEWISSAHFPFPANKVPLISPTESCSQDEALFFCYRPTTLFFPQMTSSVSLATLVVVLFIVRAPAAQPWKNKEATTSIFPYLAQPHPFLFPRAFLCLPEREFAPPPLRLFSSHILTGWNGSIFDAQFRGRSLLP